MVIIFITSLPFLPFLPSSLAILPSLPSRPALFHFPFLAAILYFLSFINVRISLSFPSSPPPSPSFLSLRAFPSLIPKLLSSLPSFLPSFLHSRTIFPPSLAPSLHSRYLPSISSLPSLLPSITLCIFPSPSFSLPFFSTFYNTHTFPFTPPFLTLYTFPAPLPPLPSTPPHLLFPISYPPFITLYTFPAPLPPLPSTPPSLLSLPSLLRPSQVTSSRC